MIKLICRLPIEGKNTIRFTTAFSFLLGFASTLPIVGITISGRDISFFKILFAISVLFFGLRFLLRRAVSFGNNLILLNIWLFFSLLSCLIGTFFLKGDYAAWSNAAKSYIPKALLFLCFSVFWQSSGAAAELNSYIAKGFMFGCLANCIWATIDAAGFYLFRESLNNIVFSNYIVRNNIRLGMLSIIPSGAKMIRASGFNTDPAQLGFVAPIVFGYGIAKKKYSIMFIAAGGILASASTTGLVCSILIAVLALYYNHGLMLRKDLIKILLIVSAVLFFAAALVIFGADENSAISTAVQQFAGRISSVYLNKSGPNIRIQYLLYAPLAIKAVLPFMLLGTGFGTASLGYAKTLSIVSVMGERVLSPYDMENTYLAYLFDNGVVGFAVFLFMLVMLFIRYRKRYVQNRSDFNSILYFTVCAIAAASALYHYILFAPQVLMMIVGLSSLDIRTDCPGPGIQMKKGTAQRKENK